MPAQRELPMSLRQFTAFVCNLPSSSAMLDDKMDIKAPVWKARWFPRGVELATETYVGVLANSGMTYVPLLTEDMDIDYPPQDGNPSMVTSALPSSTQDGNPSIVTSAVPSPPSQFFANCDMNHGTFNNVQGNQMNVMSNYGQYQQNCLVLGVIDIL